MRHDISRLTSKTDSMTDLSAEELQVLDFITKKSCELLSVERLILFGSRSTRTQKIQSDFDIAIVANAEPGAWMRLKDILRNEAPTLVDIQIVDLSAISEGKFLDSVLTEGRVFYGKTGVS